MSVCAGGRPCSPDGENSAKSSGMRTLQGFATKDMAGGESGVFDQFTPALYPSKTFLDDFTMAALDGSGVFAAQTDYRRTSAIKASLICTTWMYGGRAHNKPI
jgi:hypothetical protein